MIKMNTTSTTTQDDSVKVEQLLAYLSEELKYESDPIALMANISAAIMVYIDRLNWAGFYLVKGEELVLGPFQGLPACSRLQRNKGVCARAWQTAQAVKVDDVQQFPGHVACDSASQSELVIPLRYQDEVYAVLDLDSPETSRFTDLEAGFIQVGEMIEAALYFER